MNMQTLFKWFKEYGECFKLLYLLAYYTATFWVMSAPEQLWIRAAGVSLLFYSVIHFENIFNRSIIEHSKEEENEHK